MRVLLLVMIRKNGSEVKSTKVVTFLKNKENNFYLFQVYFRCPGQNYTHCTSLWNFLEPTWWLAHTWPWIQDAEIPAASNPLRDSVIRYMLKDGVQENWGCQLSAAKGSRLLQGRQYDAGKVRQELQVLFPPEGTTLNASIVLDFCCSSAAWEVHKCSNRF